MATVVSFLRDGTAIDIQSNTLDREKLFEVADSLVPAPPDAASLLR